MAAIKSRFILTKCTHSAAMYTRHVVPRTYEYQYEGLSARRVRKGVVIEEGGLLCSRSWALCLFARFSVGRRRGIASWSEDVYAHRAFVWKT